MVEASDLTDDEREAIQQVERGTEWLHRAHGSLVAFHHAVGRAMEHYEEASEAMEGGHADLADRLEQDVLPAGVTDDGHLSYHLVDQFETGLLATAEDVTDASREEITDGERSVVARACHEEARGS